MLLAPFAATVALALSAAGATPAPPAPAARPGPIRLPYVSCNVAVAMFAPRSDEIDAATATRLDRVTGLILPTLQDEGVSVVVSPHDVYLKPADEAEQRAIATRRGEKLRAYLAARGVPSDKISIRNAVTSPEIEDNWGEGALVILQLTEAAWGRVDTKEVC